LQIIRTFDCNIGAKAQTCHSCEDSVGRGQFLLECDENASLPTGLHSCVPCRKTEWETRAELKE